MDGFITLCRELLTEADLPEADVYWRQKLDIPGYFRPEKRSDLLAVVRGQLLAIVELKSQVGPSFGNNYNNRTEESLGNATDLWAAYREGAYKPSQRPWLGYVFLLEECPNSVKPVKVNHPWIVEQWMDGNHAAAASVRGARKSNSPGSPRWGLHRTVSPLGNVL